MKLVGSKTEQDIKNELIKSHKALFQEGKSQRLFNVLRYYFSEMKTAYCINWIPEQGEDIYTILIDATLIVTIELDRYNLDADPIVEFVQCKHYKYGLSKIEQIKLALAIELSQKDLENQNQGTVTS